MIFPTTLPEPGNAPAEAVPPEPAPPAPVRPASVAPTQDPYRGWSMALGLAGAIAFASVFIAREPTTSPRYGVVARDDAFGCMHLSVLRRIGSLTRPDPDVEREADRDCVSFSKGERLAVKQEANGFVRAQRQGDEASYWFFMGYIRLENAP
jgi:hypothetical protein